MRGVMAAFEKILSPLKRRSCAVKPAVKRKLIAGIREQFQVSERLACRVMALCHSVQRYQLQPDRDGEVIKLLLELAHGRPEQGFPKLFKRLRRLGYGWNHKRVYRVYCALHREYLLTHKPEISINSRA